MSDSTQRAELRKQLLANGYRPLPLLDKGIRIKGWSTATIDAEWLKQYERNGKYQNTGIRCDDLIAFDIDIYDEALADDIEHLIEEYCGPTELCRVGQWPKRLLLYRLDGDAIRSARTGKYGGNQVELLAGSGRQFAAYGLHPRTGKDYEWLDGVTPMDTAVADLPLLTGELAQQTMLDIEAAFEAGDLTKDSPGNTIGSSGVKLYDMADDTPIESHGVAMTWGDHKPNMTEAGDWGNLMRENGEWGDSCGVHFFISKGSQVPCAHDFPRDCTHFEEIISAAARDLIPDAPAAPVQFAAPATSVLDDMVENWVLLFDKTARMVDEPTTIYTIDGMRLAFGKHTIAVSQKTGPDKQIPVVTEWLKHRDTLVAHTSQLRPDHPDDVMFKQGVKTVFNMYRRPVHPESGGELDTLFEFVEHLIPDKAERELFFDWHAVKMLHPSYRLHALIMVTEKMGTGRNTWLGIVRRLLGNQYINDTSFKHLVGQSYGSQSEYNDYMADSLIVAVAEALEDADQGRWRTRHAAYEGLKQVVDTTATRMHIKRKRVNNTIQDIFASIIISTNHPDMLAIEDDDRRLIVLSNGECRLVDKGNLNDRLRAWEADPRNIGALYRWLMQRAIDGVQYDPFGVPMMTAAKQVMIELSRNDIDTFYEMLVDIAKGAVCTEHQLMRWVGEHYLTSGLSLPDDVMQTKRAIKSIWRKRAKVHVEHGQIRVGKSRIRPRIIKDFDEWNDSVDMDSYRNQVILNGNPGGSVVPIGSPPDSES